MDFRVMYKNQTCMGNIEVLEFDINKNVKSGEKNEV